MAALDTEELYQQESYGDSKETNFYMFDKNTCKQVKFKIFAEVDEDKLTTSILMKFDELELTVMEGEDPCIDFYYKSYQAPIVVDPVRGWSYQLFWHKGSDKDLTYDQMDQGVKAGNYQLKIGDKLFHELPQMELEDEPDIMRQKSVSQWTGHSKTTFFPIFI